MVKDNTKISGFIVDTLPKIALLVGLVSAALSFYFYQQDHHRFFFSYLTSFFFFLTISLGGFFFVLSQHITRAGWSVVLRRIPEHLMKNIWVLALFFIPVIFGIHDLYHWSHPEEVAVDHLLQVKAPYLNTNFFLIRAAFFWGIWILFAGYFFKKSTQQDESGDKNNTISLQKASAIGMLLFALTVSFSSIDWVMSLTPHWFSTMFGVYIFAGCAVSALASITILAMSIRRSGFLRNTINVEHFHDTGKLLYGFVVFWAYVAFSQYFLIWYANMPEETHWFKEHFAGNWNSVAAFIAIGHFGVPFVLFMSRHIKRKLNLHCLMAIWILFMHFVDLYWLIMPNIDKQGINLTLGDLTNFLAIGGIYLAILLNRFKKYHLYPIRDPRVEDSIHFQNA